MRVAAPDENFCRSVARFLAVSRPMRRWLVIKPSGRCGDSRRRKQDSAAGIRRPRRPSGFAGESAKYDGVNYAEAGAASMGDGQLRIMGMWIVTRFALLQAAKSLSMGRLR